MHIERIDLNKIRQEKYITSLESLEVGDSIFCEEFNQAQSSGTFLQLSGAEKKHRDVPEAKSIRGSWQPGHEKF